MGNTRAASTHGGSAANSGATSYDCTATVNCATSSVGSPAAILVSRVAIAAAGYDCSAADNRAPANGGPTTISRSTANCSASVDAAPPSGGSSLSLQSLAVYRDTIWKG